MHPVTVHVCWYFQYGAKINPGNRKQNTALHEAVQGRQPDMVATLLKNGAKSDKVNRRGLKPMELTHEEVPLVGIETVFCRVSDLLVADHIIVIIMISTLFFSECCTMKFKA